MSISRSRLERMLEAAADERFCRRRPATNPPPVETHTTTALVRAVARRTGHDASSS